MTVTVSTDLASNINGTQTTQRADNQFPFPIGIFIGDLGFPIAE